MAILVDFYGPLLPQFVRQLKLMCACIRRFIRLIVTAGAQ